MKSVPCVIKYTWDCPRCREHCEVVDPEGDQVNCHYCDEKVQLEF